MSLRNRLEQARGAIGPRVDRFLNRVADGVMAAAAVPGALWRQQEARLVGWVDARPPLRRGLGVAATIATLAFTAYVFLILNKRFYYNGIAYDEGFFVWGGWSITKGLAPYRDFIEFKPPMAFITHAFAQLLFGFKDGGYRKFFTIVPLAGVLALQLALIARRVGRVLAMALVLGVVVLFVNPNWHDTALSDCESIGFAYFLLGLSCFLWQGRFIKVTTTLGGLFMSCCVLSKEPFVLAVLFTWLGMFWLRGAPRPTRETSKLFAKYSILGVAIHVVLLCIYMVPTGAMREYIKMARGYSAIYSDPKISYCAALGVHVTTLWEHLQYASAKFLATFLNEPTLGYLGPLAAAGCLFALRRSRGLAFAMFLTWIGALWAPTATLCQWPHYYTMTMAGLLFILVAGVDSMAPALAGADRILRWGTSVVALLFVVFHGWPDFVQQREAKYVRPPLAEPVPGAFEFIKKNTVPTDRIFTSGPPAIYPEVDRVSAVRESNIIDEILGSYAGKTDEERLRPIYQQLVRNRPKVVILDPENAHRKPRHMRALLIPFLTQYHYKKVTDFIYLRP